ncbi:MAG: short-chain dehydrogenase, partial [Acidimicrobiia bacterium]|nr:short-chain dehydrogenase [Acidimicrobiia bacterium]
VFEASGGVLAVAESWHRGPSATPVDDPTKIDAIARDLLAKARPNADMNGQDRES